VANPNIIILYVNDPAASVAFYEALLGVPAAVASPGFASFALEGGFSLGLWAKSSVKPAPAQSGARTELAFMVRGEAAVDALYADWKGRGLPIEQELTTMDFGPTFVALDPDGHRLRGCLFDE